MTDLYHQFLDSKKRLIASCGKAMMPDAVHLKLFQWQRDIVVWAVKKGRCAVFLDTGLGKTFIQLEWARLLGENTLIIAPLSVARQTVREAVKIGLDVQYVRSQAEVTGMLSITNYEMVDQFDITQFKSVVLDESSILKAIDGKTRRKLTDLCRHVPYKLCCTATPAPNDWTEIGNHAEFLGICTIPEMLATFFVNANKEHTLVMGDQTYRKKGSNKGGTEWRIKHHAESHFFEWLASWAITMTKPSDLGYEDNGFILPELKLIPQFLDTKYQGSGLFFTGLHGIQDRHEVRQAMISQRTLALKQLLDNKDQWIIWVGLDAEAKAIKQAVPECVEVCGTDEPDYKAATFEAFQDNQIRILLTKPKIGGFGMNFQNAHHMVFFGLNDSWETFYQAIRREWRYGQTLPVDVHIIMSEPEQEIYQNVMRKDTLAKRLRQKLIDQIRNYEKKELTMTNDSLRTDYAETTVKGERWTAMMGDSCERLKEIPESSIDMSVYSPPFADLFTYTASDRDLGNCKGWDEFFTHYSFIIREVLRVTKPGRNTCVHTSDIPAMQMRDGYIGMRDFPGECIRAYVKEGWVFYGRAFVQKNPQAQAIRVRAKGLAFQQLRKDSSDSRPALVDQILIFKKPGENAIPVRPVDNGEMDNETWIEWANGIWLGISESDTLQFTRARGADDEKHICPLQLGTIERCIKLYSNPGETVLTPFGGIGSEAYMALKLRRKTILIELKPEYYEVALRNMKAADGQENSSMFNLMGGCPSRTATE